MRGFLSGGLWGLVFGGITAAGASLVGEQPARNDPPAEPQIAAPDALNETAATQVAPETQSNSETATAATAPAPLVAPETESPDVGSDDLTDLSETAPAALPQTVDVTGQIAAPAETSSADVTVAGEAPVLPNPQSIVPLVPATEAPIDVDTNPAAPLPGEAPEIADAAPVAEDAPTVISDSPTVAVVDDAEIAVPDQPASLEAPDQGDTAAIAGTEAPDDVVPTDDPVAETARATESVEEEPVVVAIVDDATASSLPTSTAGVRVNRLTGGAEGETAVTEEEPVAEEEFPEGTPALVRFAADHADTAGRPEVSVVLMDDGSFDGAVSAVAGVSFPVTVMLNPSVPNATDRMQAYRAAGIEVGILAALPASATASDVAIFFEAAFSTLPDTVAVLDAGEAGLQADQDVTTQAISALTEDGRGLVTVSRGLNSALRAAEEQGVPTGIIYRNLDAEGQDARVIRRFLDQAAFRARQESGVVLLGQIRGETISALIQWGAANRASQVAMVPISQVLLDEE